MFKKLLFSFTTCFLLILNAQAQKLDSFSVAPKAFLKEFETFMTASKRDKMEDAFKVFEKQWKSGAYDENEMKRIITTANNMKRFKMTASPYYLAYLSGLQEVKNTEEGSKRFIEWHDILDEILANIQNRKLKPYLSFLEFSSPFFQTKHIRYSRVGVNWIADSEDYKMTFENGRVEIQYEILNLVGTRKKDSIQIFETKGIFLPAENSFKGIGGKVYWERFGLDRTVFCELDSFEINLTKALYKVKKAKLAYPDYFGPKRIVGSFEDKITTGNLASGGSYPRFQSQDKVLKIDQIGNGIEYLGGFRLNGTTVYGFGEKDNPAVITVARKDGSKAYKGEAELFVIRRKQKIIGEQVESVIYFDQDSIYHPAVTIRFDIPKVELQLSRGKRASERNPFYSSIHKTNINSNDITVLLEKDSILIGKKSVAVGSRVNEVVFESLKYFREKDYNRVQNIATFNPIAVIKAVAENEQMNVLDANYLATRMNSKYSVENIQSLLYELVADGFIKYDSDKGEVEVKDKIFHFANANQKKVDYDVLQVHSKAEDVNGVLDLKTKKIRIEGVQSQEFSVAQQVGILPFNKRLWLGENRNIDFDGKLFAGFTTLLGKGYHFNYDKFNVALDSMRYFDIFVPSGELRPDGKMNAYAIGSRIEHLSGTLLIDAPNNKAGREDIAIFPSLNSKDNSFVYYDDKSTHGGVYNRDSFYFQLDPFSFNSLDKFGPQDVSFKGEMFSADIFPNFKETVSLMPQDTSLGFVTNTPTDGFPAYVGKGIYKGEISLSNNGFEGVGNLSYLGSSVDSEDILFKPEQLTCTAERFDLEEDRNPELEVPKAFGVRVSIDWRPYKDSMYVRSKEAPFEMFKEDNHQLKGLLILTPSGVKGRGTLDWDKASMTSDLLNMGAFSVKADTTDVKIKTFDSEELALVTSNLNADVDFDEQLGLFKANDEFLETTLPYNQYKTTMNEFTWDMKEETIEFAATAGKLGSFASIHPDQDSLNFKGKSALYDLKTNALNIEGVERLKTCDAFVYTEDGKIDIQPGGVMTTLENAKIVADTINENHVINRATVDIKGRKHYTASGYYEYNIANKEQEIFFDKIVGERVGKGKRSEKATETRASGEVKAEDNFYIDRKTEYRGSIGLSARSQNLRFDGFARLDSDNLPGKDWFSITSEAAKENLIIKYDIPRNYDGEKVYTGLYLSKEVAQVYPRVMMPLYFRKDRAIISVQGVFKYNYGRDWFVFGDSAKVVSNAMRGNQLIFNSKDGTVNAEGKFRLGSGLKYCSVAAAGEMSTRFIQPPDPQDSTASYEPYQVKANLMAGMKFLMPDKLLDIIVDDIKNASFDAQPVRYGKEKDLKRKASAEFIPPGGDFNDVLAGLNVGAFDLPKKYDTFSIFFSDLKMKWDMDYQSFVSTNAKIGIYSIGGKTIDLKLPAYVEIKMPSNEDDRLYIYFKSPSDNYYFFGYKQGVLNITSNNVIFNDEVINMKKKEAIRKMPDGEIYEIVYDEPSVAEMFVRRIKAVQK